MNIEKNMNGIQEKKISASVKIIENRWLVLFQVRIWQRARKLLVVGLGS